MRVFIIILFVFVSDLAQAQTKANISKEVTPTFANQGGQEDYWAKELFKNKYEPQVFKKFKGEISSSGDSIRFGNKTLHVVMADMTLKTIFLKGLFYPDIISNYGQTQIGKSVKLQPIKIIKDSSNYTQTDFFRKIEAYSISNFEEVKFLSNSTHIKRFRFWLFNKLVSNPEVCFIELTNSSATERTNLNLFIDGAKLTYFAHGWVVI